jgi:hypothetical protein
LSNNSINKNSTITSNSSSHSRFDKVKDKLQFMRPKSGLFNNNNNNDKRYSLALSSSFSINSQQSPKTPTSSSSFRMLLSSFSNKEKKGQQNNKTEMINKRYSMFVGQDVGEASSDHFFTSNDDVRSVTTSQTPVIKHGSKLKHSHSMMNNSFMQKIRKKLNIFNSNSEKRSEPTTPTFNNESNLLTTSSSSSFSVTSNNNNRNKSSNTSTLIESSNQFTLNDTSSLSSSSSPSSAVQLKINNKYILDNDTKITKKDFKSPLKVIPNNQFLNGNIKNKEKKSPISIIDEVKCDTNEFVYNNNNNEFKILRPTELNLEFFKKETSI